jgi:hypothetical protein
MRSATWGRCRTWRPRARPDRHAASRPRRGPGSCAPGASRVVPKVGLEPTRPHGHTTLNRARLPIPPLRRGALAAPGQVPGGDHTASSDAGRGRERQEQSVAPGTGPAQARASTQLAWPVQGVHRQRTPWAFASPVRCEDAHGCSNARTRPDARWRHPDPGSAARTRSAHPEGCVATARPSRCASARAVECSPTRCRAPGNRARSRP